MNATSTSIFRNSLFMEGGVRTENLRTRVRTLIDTSQNKVMKMKEVTLKEIYMIYSIKMK